MDVNEGAALRDDDPNPEAPEEDEEEEADPDAATVLGLESPFSSPAAGPSAQDGDPSSTAPGGATAGTLEGPVTWRRRAVAEVVPEPEAEPEEAPAGGEDGATVLGVGAPGQLAAGFARIPTLEGDGPAKRTDLRPADLDPRDDDADVPPTHRRLAVPQLPRDEDPSQTAPFTPAFQAPKSAAPAGDDPNSTAPTGTPVSPAPEEDPNATVMELKAPVLPPRRPGSHKASSGPQAKSASRSAPVARAPAKAAPPEDDDEVDLPPPGGSTVLLDSAVLGLDPKPKAKPKKDMAGAFSRNLAGAETKPGTRLEGEALDGGAADLAASRRRSRVIAVGVLAVAIVALLAVLLGGGAKPRKEALQLAYPYGFDGARGPKGEAAPGAEAVEFSLEGEVACTFERCLRYRYSEGAFQGTMIVGRRPDGSWARASDEGMPFRPVLRE